ncbi:MalY/PatB family protein [Planotetraspora kaengkrachanensis]|uniref:cysteine-S-conjugate beta-lyase n=1 Tax=Planotetraspora kaengkrachanensis TaxID=575193 RepID=A0A8J3M780_9ACTN|nr:aminotransferase class I/II-fold pyridoxal phosphate-dependent enzyme [Planotetraspora kaengkrachanensis]GIG80691.1 aminotransferase [Planotetraspora kaengkrachanensis]
MAYDLDSLSLDDARARDGIKWAATAPGVIPAWVADMDFPVPDEVREAVLRRAGRDLGYPTWVDDASVPPLAEAFAERMADRYGWRLDPGQVRSFTDIAQALQVVLRLTTRPGDAVAMHVPAYDPFFGTLRAMGLRLLPIPIGPDGRFEMPDEPARVVLLVNPQNPTGRSFTRAELTDVAEYAERHEALVISDEIHAELVHAPAVHIPFATILPERTVTLTSASKAFNMGGLHCSVAHIGAPAVRDALAAEPPNIYGSPSVLGVDATIAAWRHGNAWQAEVLAILDRNRELIAKRLPPRVGYRIPEATYLAWLDFGITDAAAFVGREAQVRLNPGPIYGGPDTHARLNFATSAPILEEMLSRITRAL